MSSPAPQLPDAAVTMEISPEAMAAWIALPPEERPRVIDCREEDELAICQIDGNEWIPLGDFPTVRDKLLARNERGVVVYCHHGVRSLRGARWLRAIGIGKAFSMRGGIEGWSLTVDPSVPRY